MKDKNGKTICVGDYVLYHRPLNSSKSVDEFGTIFECEKNFVFMTIRGGCFYCDVQGHLQLLTNEEAMLKKLELS
jgi:hypothetical protein